MDLTIRLEMINYIAENIGTKLMDFGLREDYINFTSKAREIKAKLMNRTISNYKVSVQQMKLAAKQKCNK